MDFFNTTEDNKDGERVLLVNALFNHHYAYYRPEELKELALSAGAEVLGETSFKREQPEAGNFIGSGQIEILAGMVEEDSIDLVIFNYPITPGQERNLSKKCGCRVIDRTRLILDIFALRAQTHEGRLQVELAQLKHLSTRLIRGWTHLERQKGGIGLRGPGETQLETDRRLISDRMKQLHFQLEKVKNRRLLGRQTRKKNKTPCIALVGYTNAGKSTLFNQLCSAKVYATDQLFATLDTTIRKVRIKGMGKCLLIDTVGFIQNLPHELIAAFRSTLEEAINADLLLHVIDMRDEEKEEKIKAVEETLIEIGAELVPRLNVYNKVDLCSEENREKLSDSVLVSAIERIGFSKLLRQIAVDLEGKYQAVRFCLSENSGAIRARLYELGEVMREDYWETGEISLELFLNCSAYDEIKNSPEILKTELIEFFTQPEEKITETNS